MGVGELWLRIFLIVASTFVLIALIHVSISACVGKDVNNTFFYLCIGMAAMFIGLGLICMSIGYWVSP